MKEKTRSNETPNYKAVTNEEKQMLLQPLEKEKQPKYMAIAIPLVLIPILIFSLI